MKSGDRNRLTFSLFMEKGELVPQGIVAQLLKDEVSKDSALKGFIFDGWGRRKEDLKWRNEKLVLMN